MNVEFDNRGKTFYIGAHAHTCFILENHNGTMSFGKGGLTLPNSSVSQSYLESLEKAKEPHKIKSGRTIAPENRSSSTILAAPKVNTGSVVLIKNRTSGDYFLLHHTPQDLEGDQLYEPLFQSLSQEDEIDVVEVAGHLKQTLFLEGCKFKDIKIKSSRTINSKTFFNLESIVVGREPKSLHVTYDPADDRLMIFGDESSLDRKPSCYSAEVVFANPEKQILMRRVSEVLIFPTALDSGNGWNHFELRLPLTNKSFVQRASQESFDSFIEYADENLDIADSLFYSLSAKEKEEAQKLGKNSVGANFIINSALEHLKDKPHNLHNFYNSFHIASKDLDLSGTGSVNSVGVQADSLRNFYTDRTAECEEQEKQLPAASQIELRQEVAAPVPTTSPNNPSGVAAVATEGGYCTIS
jgi:hypothetical protein